MPKFTDLMIDLETLGKRVNAAVVEVGAVFFNPETGELGDRFSEAIDFTDALRYGKADGDTLKWWFKQTSQAQQNLIRGAKSAETVWSKFEKFALLHGKDVHPWGNGATFDISKCEWQFGTVLGREPPWKFWLIQDCRTIKRAANGIVNYNDKLEGVAHSALDDAIHQAKYVSAYWQGLRNRGNSTAASKPADDDLDLDINLDD